MFIIRGMTVTMTVTMTSLSPCHILILATRTRTAIVMAKRLISIRNRPSRRTGAILRDGRQCRVTALFVT
jgi:hypothetical protein